LAGSYTPPGDTVRTKRIGNSWRLAAGTVPPGDRCKVRLCRGAWCLAVHIPRQAMVLQQLGVVLL